MARYTMQEMNDLHHEGKTLLYPRMIIDHCCESDELAREVAEVTSFSEGEVIGMFQELWKQMAWQMARGYSVKIEGIGVFTPTLELKEGKEREAVDGNGMRRNAESIRVGNVTFRPDKSLVSEVNQHCRLERTSGKFMRCISPYSFDERLKLAQGFLASHAVMTISDYADLTGLSQTTAGRELRKLYHDPSSGLDVKGRGSHRVYVLKKEE